MEKSEQKKLASKLIEVANTISGRRGLIIKGLEYMPPGYVGSEYRTGVRKKIMFVREWIAEKKKNEHAYMSIDAEEELTKMLTEELAKEIEKQREKIISQSWINKNIKGLD